MQVEELTPESLPAFRDRFGNMHDGHVHSVEYGSFSADIQKPERLRLTLGLIDVYTLGPNLEKRFQLQPENWVNVTLDFIAPTKVVIKSYPQTFDFGIIFEVHMAFIDNLLHLNFSPSRGSESDPQSYVERPSDNVNLIIVGPKCFWSTSPYKERE